MDSAARPLMAAEGGPVGSDVIDIAVVNEAQRKAQVSMLFSGRSPSEEEIRLALKSEAFKAEHKGHEKKHFVMFLIFVAVLAMLPPTVRYWRRRHPVSYRLAKMHYVSALEYMRFLVGWQPLVLMLLAGVFWVLGLE
ncbi:hypothetical protein H4S08_000378 [Coemansia sp. RSA 1365]|nr:hypothetical protein H4S08_000378 [Coemansia sp. RSA 1365]